MKLLVTTDFSANSKGAIRFAQTLSKQSSEIEVVFYHAVHFLKPTRWSDQFFNNYKTEEMERLSSELKKFVNTTLGKHKKRFTDIKFVIDTSISTEKDIISYAEKNKIDCICIATQGAGILRKIMGTHTSYIVNNSKIPVMVIPSHYRVKPLKRAIYLSDFENLKKEINKIATISTPLKLNLEVLHYKSMIAEQKKFESNLALFEKPEFKKIKLDISKKNLDLSLVERVSKYVSKSKPELLIMLTNREKGFFESIFLPSKTAELTYTTKVPVLVFSK
jgi:nucleotide-binding universal stress UspA family protein